LVRERGLLLAVWLVLLGGCASRPLMPTPNVYAFGVEPPFTGLSPQLESTEIELLYVTDRSPSDKAGDDSGYGWGRSRSAAFGSAIVRIDGELSWEELRRQSTTADRGEQISLRMERVTEAGRFPETPFALMSSDGVVPEDPGTLRENRESEQRFRAALNQRLALTPKKEVVIYVHGYNNSFEDGALTLAELWHFMGREGVPLLYTWPAGRGVFRGYAYDRESGQFTLFHLKQLLRSLAGFPEVERVHIIAHSRGTDVATTALRELFIESRTAGEDPRARYRIANLVLAAPDLDGEVFAQRVVAERVGTAVDQVTVYTSRGDKAIALAEKAFGSVIRLGRASTDNVPPEVVKLLAQTTNVTFVDSLGASDAFGHGYFHSNPAVSSDLILVVRYGKKPGAEHGRPLDPVGAGIWIVPDDYLESRYSGTVICIAEQSRPNKQQEQPRCHRQQD